MLLVSNILVLIVAALHLFFLYLEMFAWTQPRGMKAFGNSREKAELTKVMAANQGLYNGFLAAGLIWSVLAFSPFFSFELKVFFLGCVIVAALYGAWSVSRKILFIQGVPAIIALAVTLAFANPYINLDCCTATPAAQVTTS